MLKQSCTAVFNTQQKSGQLGWNYTKSDEYMLD